MYSLLRMFLLYLTTLFTLKVFLNQARAGLRLARAWFLEIDPVRIVGMLACVYVSAPEAINNQWRDVP